MFDKIFKKDEAHVPAAAPHQPGAEPARGSADAEQQGWREKITAAQGDDSALLQLAHQAPGVELKLAALTGLTGEDALRQATREFRDHDKRLHRAAKSRWQAVVARRESLAEARVLIDVAGKLLDQDRIPANRLVELDRSWEALSVHLPDETLANE